MLALPLPWARIGHAVADPALATSVAGVPLANPIGLASGFDKSVRALRALGKLGFGYVVGGTVTRAPRSGNPHAADRPRPCAARARQRDGHAEPRRGRGRAEPARNPADAPRWVSLADEAVEERRDGAELLAPHVDGFELNASSPERRMGARELAHR